MAQVAFHQTADLKDLGMNHTVICLCLISSKDRALDNLAVGSLVGRVNKVQSLDFRS